MTTAEATRKSTPPIEQAPPAGATIGWASGALILTSGLAVAAKIAGVVIAPGLRGLAAQRTMDAVDTATAALAYAVAGLLVALLCAGSFELARVRRIGVAPRAAVVGLSGLVVALASPAVITRLHPAAAIGLAIVTSVIALVAGVSASRVAHTRAASAILALLAIAGLMRPFAWQAAIMGGERASTTLFHFGTALAAIAVVAQTLGTLLAAMWLTTRSVVRGRVLANVAVMLAFVLTYVAAREADGAPSAVEAFLRASLGRASSVHLPFALASIAAFLVPASLLLALVALVQRAQPAPVLAAMTLALLSAGAFDVPLQALAAVVSAEWLMLATVDERGMWSELVAKKRRD